MTNRINHCRRVILLAATILLGVSSIAAQTTAFNYQGKLAVNGVPADGNFDVEFRLFDLQNGGAQQGATVALNSIAVSSGSFSVQLDFGACATCFNGANRYLDISVRPTGGGAFTQLSPRQQMLSTPYSIKSLNAATADGLSLACVSCITSGQIQSVSGSAVMGAIPVASLPGGSNSYIRNTMEGSDLQSADFNILGTGRAFRFSATDFAIDGFPVLRAEFDQRNTFVGLSGHNGHHNSFFGDAAGYLNTGSANSFFGTGSGYSNTTGGQNSFFGIDTGANNQTGSWNSFFGYGAGTSNSIGQINSFFGTGAGSNNTEGSENTGVGWAAGSANTIGIGNTFIGSHADATVNNLINATAIGMGALVSQSNSLVLGGITGLGGLDTNVGIGTTAPSQRFHVVGNAAIIGSLGIGTATPATKLHVVGNGAIIGSLGIGTLTPAAKLQVSGTGIVRAQVDSDSNAGLGLTLNNQQKWSLAAVSPGDFLIYNDSLGQNAVRIDATKNNMGIGTDAPQSRLHLHNNDINASFAITLTNDAHLPNHRGYRLAFDNNLFVFQRADDAGHFAQNQVAIEQETGNVGMGTIVPKSRLHLHDSSGNFAITMTNAANSAGRQGYRMSFDNNRFSFQRADDGGNFAETQVSIDPATGNVGIGNTNPADKLNVNGRVSLLLAGGGTTQVCQNASFQLAVCSSSLRYKQNVLPFQPGLSLISRLRPVSFDWEQNGAADMGLIAEDVAKVEPLLVTHNENGEIEGVKYDRVGVVLINAVNEQQTKIADQQLKINQQATKIEVLEQRIELLTKLVDKLMQHSK